MPSGVQGSGFMFLGIGVWGVRCAGFGGSGFRARGSIQATQQSYTDIVLESVQPELGTPSCAGGKPHPYSHWIRTYSSPAYLRMPAVKERIIDQLGSDVPYGRVRQKSNVFRLRQCLNGHDQQCTSEDSQCLLRWDIRHAGWSSQRGPRQRMLCLTPCNFRARRLAAGPVLHGDAL